MDYSAYYFGAVDEFGHCFWTTEGVRMPFATPEDLGLPWDDVINTLLPHHSNKQGDGMFHIKGAWTAISVHDYTADSNPGSQSTFFLRGGYRNVTMMLEELRLYPFFARVLDRIGQMAVVIEHE